MKMRCLCGSIISDNTDFISYKARYLADQDWEDFLISELPAGGHDWSLTRTMYQCVDCGRLLLQGINGRTLFFNPEVADEEVKRALASVKRERWKRCLIANWESKPKPKRQRKGQILYRDFKDEGYEYFDDFDTLERRYHELFEELRMSDVLRSAILSKDGELLHSWPQNIDKT